MAWPLAEMKKVWPVGRKAEQASEAPWKSGKEGRNVVS
jgi:hypothetical protein